MTVRRLPLIVVVPLALVGGLAGVAGARLAAPAVPIANPSAVRVAFAHGPGPWKVPISAATGNANPAAWPDACKLLSLAELKAVVPGTTSFKTAGQHAQILGGKETPHYASCKYELKGSYDTAGLRRLPALERPGPDQRHRRRRGRQAAMDAGGADAGQAREEVPRPVRALQDRRERQVLLGRHRAAVHRRGLELLGARRLHRQDGQRRPGAREGVSHPRPAAARRRGRDARPLGIRWRRDGNARGPPRTWAGRQRSVSIP